MSRHLHIKRKKAAKKEVVAEVTPAPEKAKKAPAKKAPAKKTAPKSRRAAPKKKTAKPE